MQEVFGIMAEAHPIILHTGDAANLAEWDEGLDHAQWERPGDFAPWQSATAASAGGKAEAAVWWNEALVEWQKRQRSAQKKTAHLSI
jgi:hypothetical protein